ncbi:hypothetical protein ANANG_G00236870 [Anguilla anguilla]|uniref:Uncharacterized protein n=1 Tax=Anguilla anguilla TaxID=7936 RepID=A0A9D3RNU6_ANGAN|nr:hypothetical protein ANANG_G00236870 [Anguilla anguilla]
MRRKGLRKKGRHYNNNWKKKGTRFKNGTVLLRLCWRTKNTRNSCRETLMQCWRNPPFWISTAPSAHKRECVNRVHRAGSSSTPSVTTSLLRERPGRTVAVTALKKGLTW